MRTRGYVGAACAALLLALAIATPARAQEMPLTQDQEDAQDRYLVMQGVTAGLFGVTALGGLINLYNMPTPFGDGACARGEPIFGDFGCRGGMTIVHGLFGVLTAASYTATSILADEAPDLDQGDEDTVTDALGIATATGIGLTAVLGVLAANPGILGLDGQEASDFSRVMRLVHWAAALITVGAFATHMLVDHID